MERIVENGIPAGNWDKKYTSKNPVARFFSSRFLNALNLLVTPHKAEISSITEIGCGQGHVVSYLASMGITEDIKACDFSERIIEIASELGSGNGVEFYQKDIYDAGDYEKADLVICCEVLEHLENPEKALEKLKQVTNKYCMISVPREPIWRILNLVCLKYPDNKFDTPGHIQHWSGKQFINLISKYFKVRKVYRPARIWTMALCEKT